LRRKIFIVLTLVILAVLVVATGCGTKTTTTTTTPVEPAYANAMAENILTAINEENYVKFSRDFDQTMKDALPETGFPDLYNFVKSKAGDYVSKQYYTTVVEGKYTAVVYIAKYSIKDNVTVTVSFSTVDGQNLVSGLHFPDLQ
jgi:Protein of unknown function (DUF3887)